LRFPDGRSGDIPDLRGREFTWTRASSSGHALANLLGLTTAYELDASGDATAGSTGTRRGRARSTRSASKSTVDLFDLRRRYAFLEPFLDAEYGSAASCR